MPVRSRAIALVALIGAVFGSGACSEPSSANQGPAGGRSTTATPTKTTTTASSPPTTPTTTAPQVSLPPEATKHTTEGARAFAVFYVQQIDAAAMLADPSTLRQLVDPACGGCNSMIGLVESLRQRGQHHSALTLAIARSVWSPFSTDSHPAIDVLIADAGATTVDTSGTAVSKSPSAKFTLRNTLEWRSSRWVVIKSVLL